MRSKNWSKYLTSDRNAGFGLYIHWPFCQAKCPYCDFNSHVAASIDQDDWSDAYLSELDRVAEFSGDRVLNSVFFGGGTPSLMNPQTIDAILTRVQQSWALANDIEITLEANPNSVEVDRFRAYRTAGINRVSIGIQALNNDDLKKLGRLHSADEALKALEVARDTFDRSSFDLIYARQDQTLEDWTLELTRALDFDPTHLSLYQLTIEDKTAFGDRQARGLLKGLPNEDISADMYTVTQELTLSRGLPAYEVSNHAKPNQSSKHNLIYWRGGDYLGIGPGAHGRYSLDGIRYATETHLSPAAWLNAVKNERNGESVLNVITKEDQALEYLLMSLRLAEGTDLSKLEQLAPRLIDPRNLQPLMDDGFLSEIDDDVISVPASKRILLNKILEELIC